MYFKGVIRLDDLKRLRNLVVRKLRWQRYTSSLISLLLKVWRLIVLVAKSPILSKNLCHTKSDLSPPEICSTGFLQEFHSIVPTVMPQIYRGFPFSQELRSSTSFLGSEHLTHLCIQTTEPSVLGTKHGDWGSAVCFLLQGLFSLH